MQEWCREKDRERCQTKYWRPWSECDTRTIAVRERRARRSLKGKDKTRQDRPRQGKARCMTSGEAMRRGVRFFV